MRVASKDGKILSLGAQEATHEQSAYPSEQLANDLRYPSRCDGSGASRSVIFL